jgi:hypothetical protein
MQAGTNYTTLVGSFMALALSYLVHQLSFFYIAKHSGCVVSAEAYCRPI